MDMREILEDVQNKYPANKLWADLITQTNALDILKDGNHISGVAMCAFLWGVKFSLENLQAEAEPGQLEIFECRTDDGGVGLRFGDGPIHMGYDAGDLMRLLSHIFPGEGDDIDGDLYDLAHAYLEGGES